MMKTIFRHKQYLGVISVILVVVVAAGIWLFRPTLSVEASGVVSIDIGQNPGSAPNAALSPPSLDIQVNPTGTHIDSKGYLNIRLDFYPDKDDKSYERSYIESPVIPEEGYPGEVDELGIPVKPDDYDKWRASLPTVWIITPCHTHFIKVPVDVTKEELVEYINSEFNGDVTTTLDNILVQEDSAHLLSPFMRDKVGLPADIVSVPDKKVLIDAINERLYDVSVLSSAISGQVQSVLPESIDVGSAAIDRDGYSYSDYTYLDDNNPANADGTIDTIDFYVTEDIGNIRFGLFYNVSGTTYHCRSGSGDLGNFYSGLRQVTGLSLAVETGDIIGTYTSYLPTLHPIEKSSSGYNQVIYVSGEYIDTDDEGDFSGTYSGDCLSVYGTGTESGAPDINNTPSSATSDPLGPSDNFSTGLDYFTVTNNSGCAVNITISGTDITGGIGWALSDTGTPGVGTAGIKAGLDGGSYNIVVKRTAPYNTLKSNLAASASQDWGLQLLAPTNYTDSVQKAGTVTLTATIP